MKKTTKLLLLFSLACLISTPAYAYSARHHLIEMGKNAGQMIGAPLEGIFINGPQNIKKAYTYEVWEREDQQKRGLLRYKLFALWRTPGEEAKGIIEGVVESVKAGGSLLKNLLSIFFSD